MCFRFKNNIVRHNTTVLSHLTTPYYDSTQRFLMKALPVASFLSK